MDALALLVGTWSGEGAGEYPSIKPFAYREEVTFAAVPGKPFLVYRQSTVRLDTNLPAHSEVGYLRPIGDDGRVELVLAHPTGLAELASGTATVTPDGLTLHLTATIHGTPTAKDVTAVERTITITADTLHYDLSMAAVGHPLTHHLTATLHRSA